MLFRLSVLLMISSLCSGQAVCQNPIFFVKGATWYYDAGTGIQHPDLGMDSYGILVLKYTRDTVIEGLDAVVIEETAYNALGRFQNYPYWPDGKWIMRQEGMKILHYTDDGFQILYDFGAEKGDTIISSLSGQQGYNRNPEFMFVIDSTSFFNINGRQLPEYYFDSNIYIFDGRSRFLIGNDTYLPVPHGLASDAYYGPDSIRCYKNDSITLNFVDAPCGAGLITSVFSKSKFNEWKIYPNPTTDKIKVIIPAPNAFNIKVIDLTGKTVLEEKQYFSEDLINIQSLQPGLYQIIADNKAADNLRFIKM